MSTAAIQSDTTWLRTSLYQIASLNMKLAGRVPEMQRALEAGLPAYADPNRANFYDVELPSGWAYIHVRDDNRTVYLIAFSPSN
jgi:hypothetical protein